MSECNSPSTPGNRALAVMNSPDTIQLFKKPQIPARRSNTKRQTILNEDTYIEGIGEIIERDFFPDLKKLRAQNDYLDAMVQNDAIKLRELYAKYSSGTRPESDGSRSPETFETPILHQKDNTEPSRDDNDSSKSNVESVRSNISNSSQQGSSRNLDSYLSSHTSEDNESFQEIMKESVIRHKQRYAWLYKDEEESEKMNKDQLALPPIEKQAEISDRPFNVDTWKYKNRNYIMYVPDGVPLSIEEKIEQANQRQEVVHTNTRLQRNPFDEQQNKEVIKGLAVTQARTQDGKIGVDGKELTNETPKINGFSFVKMDSPMPGVMDSPLMTWGEIEGTPFRLDGGDTPFRATPGPSFKMPAPTKRETLALALAEKAGERHRDRKQKALEAARRLASPSPRPGTGSLERLHSMSPAAQRLATQRVKSGDDALRASYSPSPRRASGVSTPDIGIRTPSRLTPSRTTPLRRAKPSTPKPASNLTDNLLQLPKRSRASDFF